MTEEPNKMGQGNDGPHDRTSPAKIAEPQTALVLIRAAFELIGNGRATWAEHIEVRDKLGEWLERHEGEEPQPDKFKVAFLSLLKDLEWLHDAGRELDEAAGRQTMTTRPPIICTWRTVAW